MFKKAKRGFKSLTSSETSTRKGTIARQLGIDVSALIHSFITETKGELQRTDYNLFWQAIAADESELDMYLQKLLLQVISFTQGKKKFAFDVQTVMNTISFLSLRLELPMSSKAVVEIVKKYGKSKKTESRDVSDAIKLVFSILHQRLVDKTDALSSLVIQCHQFYSASELNRIADYYNNPTIFDVYGGGASKLVTASCENAFTWHYLKSICESQEIFKQLLTEIDIKLKATAGVVFVDPKLAELSLLSLVFMIDWLVAYWRMPDPMFVDLCMGTCKRFYLWPIPYGSCVRDLLLRMSSERISPGICNLTMIWKECRLPEIIIRESDDLEDLAGGPSEASVDTPMSRDSEEIGDGEVMAAFRPLYYIMDKDDSKALLWANLLHVENIEQWSSGRTYEVHTGVSARTAVLLILNMFSNEIEIRAELISGLKLFQENDAHEWYAKVVDVYMTAAKKSSFKEASAFRKAEFSRLSTEIIEASSKMVFTDTAVDLTDLPSDFRNCAPLLIPQIKHTSIICDLSIEESPKRGAIASGDVTFPANDVLSKLVNLLSNFASLSSAEDPMTIRLAIGGGNKLLNAVCCAYASLFRYYDGLIRLFKLEFLLIPLNSNNYCDWLARQDPWYNRHIYLPLTSPQFVLPSVRFSGERPKKRVTGAINCVGDYYRDMIEDYSRESEHFIRAFLWELHAWKDDKVGSTPDFVIPFAQRVEIGKRAEYRGFRAMFTAGGDDEISEVVDEKEAEMMAMSSIRSADAIDTKDEDDDEEDSFEFMPQVTSVEWQNVDLIGNPLRESFTQHDQCLNELCIRVCPRYGDKNTPPNPCDEGTAVMNAVVRTRLDKKKKKGVTYNLLKNEPCQRIRQVTVTVKDGEEKLWALVDDRLYGPYAKIRTSPMVNPFDKRQVYLPICTFFPVDSIVS